MCSRRPDYRDFYATVPCDDNVRKKSGYLPETRSLPYRIDAKIVTEKITINGETYSIDDIPDATDTAINNLSLKLGAYPDGSSYPSSWWVGTCERFSAKLASGEVNFIPAIDPTGAPCMFDLVSRKPFYNAGTGDFIYPNMETQATTYSLRRRDYAQMTEHGIRRLYHVPNGCELTKEEYAEQNGFKLLVEIPQPEEGYWRPVWHEREDCIELEWIETEEPTEEI